MSIVVAWQAVDGDVLLRADDVDWWGASLSILVAAIHHPDVLAEQQPDTDAELVAREVLDGLPELQWAAETFTRRQDQTGTVAGVSMVLDGDFVRISPGCELPGLVLCLEVFARAVLDSSSAEDETARGALAYSAAAWSRELGATTGALRADDGEGS